MSLAAQSRQTIRRLLQSPMFTFTTLMTLAIGVGATTAIFSLVYGVLFKPLPYADPDRLVAIWHTSNLPNLNQLNSAPSTYLLYREEGKVFEDVALWRTDGASITGLAEPERVSVLTVSDGFLPVLGIQPQAGRFFTRADDAHNAPETVILTDTYWREKFGADPKAIGKTLLVDGRSHEIIGVLPAGFTFMDRRFSILLPHRFNPADIFIGNFSYESVARLKPGFTTAQANADVGRMLPMLLQRFRPAPGMSVQMLEAARVGPLVRPLKDDAIGDIARVLWVLMATVGIVLFIACANVANLLLVRVEARQRELAVRSALGAGWGRLAGELLLESAILGVAGGAIGIALAYGALQLLTRLNANLPRLSEIGLDLPVLLFAAAVSLLSGLLFGLAPVFKYAGPRLDLALRSGGRSGTAGRERHHTRNLLVVTQVAMALVLLVGAGLMIRTLLALQDVDPGFRNPDEVLMLRVSIPEASIADPKQVAQTYKNMAERIAAIPGVQTVALTNSATLDFSNNNDPIFPEGRADYDNKLPPIRRFKHLGPGYFATMGKRLVAGRDFTWTDVFEMRNVVILSESLARELYGQPASALGRRVRERPGAVWREVIGVAAQERDDGVNRPAPTIVYWPLLKGTFWVDKVSVFRSMVFVVRSPRTGTQVFLGEVRQAVWAVNAALPVSSVRTLRESYDRSMARTSFTLVMLALSAGMALFLGVIGIYGVISYSVAQRTKEIGIRIALGAQQSAVRQLFLGQGMLLAGIGVAIGLAGAVVLSRYLSALLYGVPPLDALTYASVAALLIAVALLATYVPASRAASVEPMTSLRAE